MHEKVVSLKYRYDKVGLDVESSLPLKNCVTLDNIKNTYAFVDAYSRMVLDCPTDIDINTDIGEPDYIEVEYETCTNEYSKGNVWERSNDEVIKFITNRGTTLYSYFSDDELDKDVDNRWCSIYYSATIDNFRYRLAETYFKKLYNNIQIKYVRTNDTVKVDLKFEEEIEQGIKKQIYLVFSLIYEMVLTDCKVYIIGSKIRSIIGSDIFRKLKRIINAQSNVVQCVFV